MKVYHQLGFRDKWNLDSYRSGIGDGLIFSPINMDSEKLLNLPSDIREHSFIDPQLYLLNTGKSSNVTYPFFPGNIKADYVTADLDSTNSKLAQLCIDYQLQAGFEYIVIPNRYYEELPSKYYELSMRNFIIPFLDYKNKMRIQKPLLLSIIIKQIMIEDQEKRDELLNWMTGIPDLTGFYVVFDNNYTSKQIKDFAYLNNILNFIRILRSNGLEVHIGYCNTEALLYTAAMPNSITVGAYENLRTFKISRFEISEGTKMRSPNPRLYSTKLLQWMEYNYIESMKALVPDYLNYFDDSEYKPLMFNLEGHKEYKWHFAKSELYKHYFKVFTEQIKSLPEEQNERIECLKSTIRYAINNYAVIKEHVLLDGDSDDSHLSIWYNVLNAFKKEL